jgi:hypothetical protein
MSSESVCQLARSWVDVGSFHTRLLMFMIFTASVRNIVDYPRILDLRSAMYCKECHGLLCILTFSLVMSYIYIYIYIYLAPNKPRNLSYI